MICISLCSTDGENPLQIQASESDYNRPTHKSVIQDSRGKGWGEAQTPWFVMIMCLRQNTRTAC